MNEAVLSFRLGYVPGVFVDKWVRRWRERVSVDLDLQLVSPLDVGQSVVLGRLDAALLRLPVTHPALHCIPLYVEESVLVLPRDSDLAKALRGGESLSLPQLPGLDDSLVLWRFAEDRLEWATFDGVAGLAFSSEILPDATTVVEVVASGVGAVVLPMAVAKVTSRKEVVVIPLTEAPKSQIGLVWSKNDPPELIDTLIAVVRGRTLNSSRDAAPVAKDTAKGASKGSARSVGKKPGGKDAKANVKGQQSAGRKQKSGRKPAGNGRRSGGKGR